MQQFSADEARRVVANATWAARRAGYRSVYDVVRYLGAVQLDPFSVIARAHQLTIGARLPHLTHAQIDDALWPMSGHGVVAEAWAHVATIVAVEDWPLWQWRRERLLKGWQPTQEETMMSQELLARLRDDGPLTMPQLRASGVATSGWDYSPTKHVLEVLLRTGQVVSVARRGLTRVFDLPERALPGALLEAHVGEEQALVALLRRAAAVMGVATVADLADYWRMKPREVREQVEAAGLVPTRVEGWKDLAWTLPGVGVEEKLTEEHSETMAVAPFDNTVWFRSRCVRVWGFTHLFEAYKPAAQRMYGLYVCPILMGSHVIGRADLRREGPVMQVVRASLEAPWQSSRERHNDAVAGMARALRTVAWQVGATAVQVVDGPRGLKGAVRGRLHPSSSCC